VQARERDRRALHTAAASAVNKLVLVGVTLASVPIRLQYLGDVQYGLWMTAAAMAGMLTFADFGIGSSLVNELAATHASDDRDRGRRAVSTATLLLLALTAILGAAFATTYRFVDWAAVLNVGDTTLRPQAGAVMAVLVALVLASVVLGLVQKIQLAHQEGYISFWCEAAAGVLTLGALAAAVQARLPLPLLVVATLAPSLLVTLANGTWMVVRARPWLRPGLDAWDAEVARRLVRRGGLFFVMQLVAAAIYASDNIIVSRLFGPRGVTAYAVPLRLFAVIPMTIGFALTPMWPAYVEALRMGDHRWLRSRFVHSLMLAVGAAAVVAAVMVAAGPQLVQGWSRSPSPPSRMLLGGMAVLVVAMTAGTALSMLLNGMALLRVQVWWGLVLAPAAIGAQIAAGRWFGVAGVAWGAAAAYLLLNVLPLSFYAARALRTVTSPSDGSCRR
jgi:O-antigen/teichoic acid export membrane protein